MFDLNYRILNSHLTQPSAVFWKNYVPQSARNSLSNLEEPVSMVNVLLVANPYKAMQYFSRFFKHIFRNMQFN